MIKTGDTIKTHITSKRVDENGKPIKIPVIGEIAEMKQSYGHIDYVLKNCRIEGELITRKVEPVE